MKYHLFIIIFLLCFMSCNLDHQGILNSSKNIIANQLPLRLNSIIYIAYQDTLYNQQENIWITFDSLLEDSRCPVDVVCVWEGNARLSFIFGKNDGKAEFILNTNFTFTTDTLLYGYKISLVEVLPIPYSNIIYKPEDYVAKIIVQK